MRFSKIVLVLAVVALMPFSAQAATVQEGHSLIPAGLGYGDTFQIMFVTSGTTNMSQNSAVLTPAQIADAFVQDAADNTVGTVLAGLGTWKAVASFDGYTSHPSGVADAVQEHAKDRAPVFGKVYRPDGVWLADNSADLWDGDIAGIADGVGPNVSETLGGPGHSWAYTGTNADGTLITPPGCAGGDAGATFGCGLGPQDDRTTVGYPSDFLGEWMQGNLAINADNVLAMYGMSELITVVPEPSTMALMMLGAAGLAVLRRSRSQT